MLGPVLYLRYVNDINYSCNCNILFVTDNTTIISSHANINYLFLIGNKDLNYIYLVLCQIDYL